MRNMVLCMYFAGCPNPSFNSHTEMTDLDGNPLAQPPRQFGAVFNVSCEAGYYFASEEFGTCGKYIY